MEENSPKVQELAAQTRDNVMDVAEGLWTG